MTYRHQHSPLLEEKSRGADSALDVFSESEGGFPCGEFLWDDEEEAMPPAGEGR